MTAVDWPAPADDPTFYRAPELNDFRDDRDGLERLLLAALCWSAESSRERAFQVVTAADFHYGRNRTVFEALLRLRDERRPVTPGEVYDVTGEDLQSVLGLFDGYPGEHPLVYAELVADWARRERLMNVVTGLPDRVKADSLDPDEVAAEISRHAGLRQHGIDTVNAVWDDVELRIAQGEEIRGVGLERWPRLRYLYRVEQGLWTVVTGVPGSGKSTWLDNLTLGLAVEHDWRFAVFSAESAPTPQHIVRLLTMHSGRLARLGTDELDGLRSWLHDRFEWVNSTEGVTVDEILSRADVVHRRRPINGLVVDPWNEIDREASKDSETLRISEGLTKIRRWARRRNVHVWIVAHPTKLQKTVSGNYQKPTLYDISGSATWRDKADMGVVVHRNQLERGPTEVDIVKVRFQSHGRIGQARFVFDESTETYSETAL